MTGKAGQGRAGRAARTWESLSNTKMKSRACRYFNDRHIPCGSSSGWRITMQPRHPCKILQKTTITYSLKVGKEGFGEGGRIFFSFGPNVYGFKDASKYAPQVQWTDPRKPNYSTIHCNTGRLMPAGNRAGWYLIKNNGSDIPPGAIIQIRLGDSTDGKHGFYEASNHPSYEPKSTRFFIDSSGAGRLIKLESPYLKVMSGPFRHLFARSPTHAAPGRAFPLTVEIADKFGNLLSGFNGRSVIKAGPTSETIGLRKRNAAIFVVPIRFPKAGLYRPTVMVKDNDCRRILKARSNPVIVAGANSGDNIYWGEIHVHSSVSVDGVHSPEFCFHYAREIARLDFFALSDHSNTLKLRLNEKYFSQDSSWQTVPDCHQDRIRRLVKKYHRPGNFVPFFGYEWTGNNVGQVNVYHGDDHGFFINGMGTGGRNFPDTPAKLCALLKGKNAIVIPHHPAYAAQIKNMGFNWKYFDSSWMPVVEIYSARHGCSEYAGCPRHLGPFDPERSIQAQLALGRRFGFIAGTDGHIGMAARRLNRAYGPHQKGDEKVKNNSGGLIAVFAGDLTRQSIMKSLRSRRCYAVTGDRLLLRFNVAGHPMGAILTQSEKESFASREITISVEASSPIGSIEIVRNNRVIQAFTVGKMTANLEYADKEILSNVMISTPVSGIQVFYYCRVYLKSGEMAWSSPVWIQKQSQS